MTALIAYTQLAVMVLISAWMPAPPLESLPAIVNAVYIKSSSALILYSDLRWCPQSAAVIYHFLAAALSAQRTKKVQESNAKIPAQKMLVTYYLPTLALSKSGSGLKHPLTLSPPVRAPRFHYPYHFVMVCFITALLYTPVLKMQAFCSVLL